MVVERRAERVTFKALTGRAHEPGQRVEEAWFVIGRAERQDEGRCRSGELFRGLVRLRACHWGAGERAAVERVGRKRRGRSVTLVSFWRNEAEYSTNPDKEVLDAARPALSMTGGPLICISYKRDYGAKGDPPVASRSPGQHELQHPRFAPSNVG